MWDVNERAQTSIGTLIVSYWEFRCNLVKIPLKYVTTKKTNWETSPASIFINVKRSQHFKTNPTFKEALNDTLCNI